MTDGRLPSVSLLPGMLPNEELFWHWRRGIAPYFESVPLADPRRPPLVPEIHLYNAGGFLFFDTKFSRQKFVRDAGWLRRNDDSDHVGLQLFLRGGNQVENGGRDYYMGPGSVFAVNLGYEIDASCTDAEVLSIILSRDWLSEHLPALLDARGAVFPEGSMAARLFGDFMLSLRRNLPTATNADAPLLSDAVLGMLRSLVASGDPLSVEARSGVLAVLQQYVEDNLSEPDLGVETLCARFRMSRASLYRLFKDLGGVRDYIQRRRLLACFKALTTRANMSRGIFEVALDCGFSSPSHLATRFRQHFGMSPSEVREAALSRHADGEVVLSGQGGLSEVELMRRWTRELGASARAVPNAADPRRS
ncbi:MAG: helix-turn-helix domain-containing protein [Thalassobaculum sp.]|uniref:helix-turn-helix domain-containing protein n=1 Tax=Thalassobaculum sp. TaxID=2022740 RepID=UPI0032EC4B75